MIEFEVQDMTCSHCVGAVTHAVKTADPQAKVEVDLPAHRVRVDTTQDRQTIAAALAEAGYPTT